MNNIFDIAGLVSPVADSIGIGQVWRNMVVERTAQSCALAALQAAGKGHSDLIDLADRCFDHCFDHYFEHCFDHCFDHCIDHCFDHRFDYCFDHLHWPLH